MSEAIPSDNIESDSKPFARNTDLFEPPLALIAADLRPGGTAKYVAGYAQTARPARPPTSATARLIDVASTLTF